MPTLEHMSTDLDAGMSVGVSERSADGTSARGPRIVGIDVARAVAMLGMIIVHFARFDGSGGALDTIAESMRGRAMPLFMLLGGLGVTLVSRRAKNPDRGLFIRAVILLMLGLALHELSTGIAIVLQSYALFFAVSPLLRRLPSTVLVGSAAMIAVAGSVTYQTVGQPRRTTPYTELFDRIDGVRSLVFDGFYPFFPVAAFFILGMWIGRLDLRQERIAGVLTGVGVAVGVGSVWGANVLVDWFDVDRARFGIGGPGDDRPFTWVRLLDHTGHSEMLAWVLSATGTAAAVLGLSLLITPRLGVAVQPVASLGALALTFYAFQALMTNVIPEASTTSLAEEFVTVTYLYLGFMVFAYIWKLWFRSGPLEALLRIGSGQRTGSVSHRFQRWLTSGRT